jgi:hypothetical protein
VTLRCQLLTLLRIHHPDCRYCAREKYGMEMRKRLEELNWRTQTHSPTDADREEIVTAFDSAEDDVVSRTPAA